MAKTLANSILLGTFIIVLAACQQSPDNDKDSSEAGYRFLVIKPQDKNYTFAEAHLTTVESVFPFRGSTISFLTEPQINQGNLNGTVAELNISKSDKGYFFAKDNLSLQLLTLYHSFEKLRAFDTSLKLKSGEVLDKYNRWPLKIFVDANLKVQTGFAENNVLYTGKFHSLLFVPYTESELPLMVNFGVMSHEHFHGLFYNFVGHLFNYDELTNYHKILLRAIDEGLADVWGLIMSDDENFVGRSLPSEEMARKLTSKPVVILKQKDLEAMAKYNDEATLISIAYEYGSQMAKTIVLMLAKVESKQQRAAIVFDVLKDFKDQLQKESDFKKQIPANWMIKSFANKLGTVDKKSCEVLELWESLKSDLPLWGCK